MNKERILLIQLHKGKIARNVGECKFNIRTFPLIYLIHYHFEVKITSFIMTLYFYIVDLFSDTPVQIIICKIIIVESNSVLDG